MLVGQPVRQIAFYVEDVRAAAKHHSELFGSGPFFVLDLPAIGVTCRGDESLLNLTCAVGQWGAMQVEFMQESAGNQAAFCELFSIPGRSSSIHHAAIIVKDLEAAVSKFLSAGHKEVLRLKPAGSALISVFMDTMETYGFFIELYEPVPTLMALYKAVADASVGFDGDSPVRDGTLIRPAR